MTTFRKLTLIVLVLFFISGRGVGQIKNFASKEKDFVKLYSKLLFHVQVNYDSTLFYSERFSDKFEKFIRSNPTTLDYQFKRLIDSNYCQIRTSSDGNLRIYSWDKWTGGTMHEFNQIYQWRNNGKVFTKVPSYSKDNPGSFCSRIFTVDINYKRYYLAVTDATYSTKNAAQSISAFTIVDKKLVDTVKVFKTKTQRLNRIDLEYDFFSVIDRPERPLELITYDEKLKIIYVPVVDNKGQVTNRNILYQLKEKYFEFIGIERGKRK